MKKTLAAGQWIHAAAFETLFDWSPRECRFVRKLCKGSVISGNKGYKLALLSTVEEVDRCASRLHKQADEIKEDALDVQRFFHQHKHQRPERG